MTEVLYGPFNLRAWTDESNLFGRFTISGSNGSDGLYQPVPDDPPLEFAVDGAQWQLDFEARTSDTDWFEYFPTRGTAFTAHAGLAVKFWTPPIAGGGFVFRSLLVVECVSTDPVLSPPVTFVPVDLTLPEG